MGGNSSKPKPGSANSQAKGSQEAAAESPKAAGQKSGETFKLDRPNMSVQHVPLSKLFAKPEENSYRGREDDPYSKDALKGLMESIKMQGGINTPLLLQARPGGHLRSRRWPSSLLQPPAAVADGVAGFSADMLVPANVLGLDTDELTFVTASVSGNVEREPLPAEGRMDATLRLHKAGMPRQSIADLLHVSKSSVDRDITARVTAFDLDAGEIGGGEE